MKKQTQARSHHNKTSALSKAHSALNLNVVEKPESPAWDIIKDYKVVCLRETRVEDSSGMCDTPEAVAEYWNKVVASHPYFNAECECFVVLLLNTKRKVKGNQLISIGTLDTILFHPREVFRAAIVSASYAIILMHNHPSGDSTPSDADIRVTRELLKAGQLLKIEVLDHVIIGRATEERPRGYTSLRELGYFFSDHAPDYKHRRPARLSRGVRKRLELSTPATNP